MSVLPKRSRGRRRLLRGLIAVAALLGLAALGLALLARPRAGREGPNPEEFPHARPEAEDRVL